VSIAAELPGARHILLKRADDRRTQLLTELKALYRRVDQLENKLVNQEREMSLLRVHVSPEVVVETRGFQSFWTGVGNNTCFCSRISRFGAFAISVFAEGVKQIV